MEFTSLVEETLVPAVRPVKRGRRAKAVVNKPVNVPLDVESVAALGVVQEALAKELGFVPSLAQTIGHLIMKARPKAPVVR